MKIAFVTRGGRFHGLGHVTRCVTLARQLKASGIEPFFILEDYPEGIKYTKLAGFKFSVIKKTSTIKEKAEKIKSMCSKSGISLIYADFYRMPTEYIRFLKKFSDVIAFMQLDFINMPASAVVNHCIAFDNITKKNNYGVKCYLGPKYLPMNPIYAKLHKKRRKTNDVSKILITMGSEDREGLVVKALGALRSIEGVEIAAVIGHAFQHTRSLNRFLKSMGSFRILYRLPQDEMAKTIWEADLCLTAAGNTLYEASCLGVPTLVLSEAYHQFKIAEIFSSKSLSVHLGYGKHASEKTILSGVLSLMKNDSLRKSMCVRGRETNDGGGAGRIVKIIEGVLS